VPPETHIVLIGDVDQLGPIGARQPFADMIESGMVPVTRLDEVFRFKEGGEISQAAKAVNSGDVGPTLSGACEASLSPDNVGGGDAKNSEPTELIFMECPDPCEARETICDLVANVLPEQGVSPNDVQILVPRHGGDCGRIAFSQNAE
jgi:exodeoxyribonuclease V alpha subunit